MKFLWVNSFVGSLKVEDKFYTEQIKGTVTDISLNYLVNISISVDGSDFFFYLSCLNFSFQIPDTVVDAFEALITDNKDFISSLSKPTLLNTDL